LQYLTDFHFVVVV